MLEVTKIARSTYYYYLKRENLPDKYLKVKEEIQAIFSENQGRYGYRRITIKLRNRGYKINHKTVQRLMHVLNLKCIVLHSTSQKISFLQRRGWKNRTKSYPAEFPCQCSQSKMDYRYYRIPSLRKETVFITHP